MFWLINSSFLISKSKNSTTIISGECLFKSKPSKTSNSLPSVSIESKLIFSFLNFVSSSIESRVLVLIDLISLGFFGDD